MGRCCEQEVATYNNSIECATFSRGLGASHSENKITYNIKVTAAVLRGLTGERTAYCCEQEALTPV